VAIAYSRLWFRVHFWNRKGDFSARRGAERVPRRQLTSRAAWTLPAWASMPRYCSRLSSTTLLAWTLLTVMA